MTASGGHARILPMRTTGTEHFIDRTYREGGTFQWVCAKTSIYADRGRAPVTDRVRHRVARSRKPLDLPSDDRGQRARRHDSCRAGGVFQQLLAAGGQADRRLAPEFRVRQDVPAALESARPGRHLLGRGRALDDLGPNTTRNTGTDYGSNRLRIRRRAH